ncbi:unnamed protein product [Rhodiola kirilowii]
MEIFAANGVQFTLLSLAISLFYLAYKCVYNKGSDPKIPRGSNGWPKFGETLHFVMASRMGKPEGFVQSRMAKHSEDVFKSRLLGEDMAVLCGAAGNKLLFSGHNKIVTNWWPSTMKKSFMFPSTVKNSIKDESTILRSFLPEFLKPESLQHYIPIMDAMAKDHVARDWNPHDQVKVFPMSKKYTFALACKLFLSIDDEEQVEKLAHPFSLVTAGFFALPVNFPGTTFYKAQKGGEMIREMLLDIIVKKRVQLNLERLDKTSLPAAPDMATRMLLSVDENGTPMHEKDISNKIIGLLIASHDTTSSAITSVFNYLAMFPHIYNQVLQEQMEVAKAKSPGELLNWEDLKKMKYSWNVACEAMRLQPPAGGAFREVISEFTFAGFTIPKGWKAYWSVHSTHKNPKYFPNPEKFDPTRFEGNGPAPYSYVPFGGGPKMCPGKEYARLEVLTFIHNVVTKFKWEKLFPDEEFTYNPIPIPLKDLPVRLTAHQN